MRKIFSSNEAVSLLSTHVLISKTQGQNPLFYMLSTDGNIIVTNETRKYYITVDEFKYNFYEADYFVYKSLKELAENDVEIDQEFRKLRQ